MVFVEKKVRRPQIYREDWNTTQDELFYVCTY